MNYIIVNARYLTQKITGVQRFAIELSLLLAKHYPNIIFVSPKHIIHADLALKLNVIQFGIGSGHFWEQLELPLFCLKYKKALLINLCNTAPLIYNSKIVSVHDLGFIHNPKWFSKKFELFYKFLIPKIVKSSLKVITVSNYSKLDLVEKLGVSPEKIGIVYNGVGAAFKPQNKDLAFKAISQEAPYILAVSSMDPRKNFTSLVRAFHKVKHLNVRLVIVGGRYKTFSSLEFDENILNSDLISFTGYVSDQELVHLYQNALFFVFPSLFEGFGIPPLEAMACGCPTLVSDIPAIREVCQNSCYYINPLDENSIVQGMLQLISDFNIRQDLSQKGFDRVMLFNWISSFKQLVEIIDSANLERNST